MQCLAPRLGLERLLFLTSDNVLFPRLDFFQTSTLVGVVSSSSPLDGRPQASIILNDCSRPILLKNSPTVLFQSSLGVVKPSTPPRASLIRDSGRSDF